MQKTYRYRSKHLIKEEERIEDSIDKTLETKFSSENRGELNFEPDYRALFFQEEREY